MLSGFEIFKVFVSDHLKAVIAFSYWYFVFQIKAIMNQEATFHLKNRVILTWKFWK